MFFLSLSGQSNPFISKLNVEYEMYLNISEPLEYSAILFSNDSISLFTYSSKEKSRESLEDNSNELGLRIYLADTVVSNIVTNKRENTLYTLRRRIISKPRYYYTVEEVPNFKWKIERKEKLISGIKCYLANLKFRGREYSVWYAPSIPSQFGPWKLGGLPGLILEASDVYNEVVFRATKIEFIEEEIALPSYESYEVLSLEQHIYDVEKNMEAFEKKLRSRMPKGTNVQLDPKARGIELNFNDLQ